ncbi:hypothetical protein [Rhodovulum sp.]|uniref:hypothetical protein n=1 Tax=Rhodovulum sp. TaxID=34009 RepID=UPI0032E4FFEF
MKPLIAIAALAFGPALAEDNRASPLAESHIWNELRTDLVGKIDIADAAGRFEVQAPYRANDAATVPVTIRQTDPGLTIRGATVVIDDIPHRWPPASPSAPPWRRSISRSGCA